MIATFTACIVVVALRTVAEPLRYEVRDDQPTTAPPITVTVTVPASVSAPPDVTVTRTITRSSWTSTTVAVLNLNCTQQVYAPLPTIVPTPSPLPSTGGPILKRQISETSTTDETKSTTSSVSSPLTSQRARTRTTTLYTTVTQTEPFTRTRYQCAATIAYAFTVDTTATISYTQTRYQSTAVSTSTIICPGVGGFPLGYTVPRAPPPRTTEQLQGRQTASPQPITTAPVSSLAALGTLTTITVHQTRTAYTIITLSVTDIATNVRYACSTLPFDVSVTYPITRTAWPSTTTIVSYLNCGRLPIPSITPQSSQPTDETMGIDKLRRQAGDLSTTAPPEPSSEPQSQTLHRTTYVASPVTITASTDSTRLVYSCSLTAAPPSSTSSSSS